MSHLRRVAIPNAWDDDEWDTPSTVPSNNYTTLPSSAPITLASEDAPIIVTSATQQPKSFYKPELTILKRTSPASSSSSPKPSNPSSRSEERERKERERRDRERRYQEAKDRIFAPSTTTTTTIASDSMTIPEKKGKKKKAAIRSSTNTQPNTPNTTPPPLQTTGAITGFSLNSGSLSVAPVKARERQEWQLRQVALDGKMLESQAEAYGFGRNEELLGDKERGLDWDEFRRDRWSGAEDYQEGGEPEGIEGQLGRLELVGFGESASGGSGDHKSGSTGGGLMPVREPRGPDASKGFRGRGRGTDRRGGFGAKA